MAQIEFTDWNNYTDYEGTAQTLDWDNLPSFVDLNTGLTAITSALNEKIKVINFLAGNIANTIISTEYTLTPLHPVRIMKDIDSKLDSITRYFYDLELYPSLDRYIRPYLLKEFLETEHDMEWIDSEPFVPFNLWLYQRYLLLNKLIFLRSVFASSGISDSKVRHLYKRSEQLNMSTNTFQDLVNSFNSAEYEINTTTVSVYRHHISSDYMGNPTKQRYSIIWRYGLCFDENYYNSNLILGYNLYATRGIVSEFYEESSTYENNDSFALEGVPHEYIISTIPVNVSNSFDFRDYYDASTVTDFIADPNIQGLQNKGYRTNTWFGGLTNQSWIYKLNVEGGFKFVPPTP